MDYVRKLAKLTWLVDYGIYRAVWVGHFLGINIDTGNLIDIYNGFDSDRRNRLMRGREVRGKAG